MPPSAVRQHPRPGVRISAYPVVVGASVGTCVGAGVVGDAVGVVPM